MFSSLALFASLLPLSALGAPVDQDPKLQSRTIPDTSSLQSRDTCYDYVIMDYPGGYDPTGNRMVSTIDNINTNLQGYSGTTFLTQHNLPYGVNDYMTYVQAGIQECVDYVKSVHSSCPNTKFILFGFSFGTFQIMGAVNDASMPRDAISAVLLFGNAYWLPNQPQDRGTATSGHGANADTTGSLTLPANYVTITEDWCDYQDYFCTGAQYTGSGTNPHLDYQNNDAHIQGAEFCATRVKSDLSLLGLGGTLNQATGGATLDPITGNGLLSS